MGPSETQDDNNEIDGSFEVVPGVTADEYIKRFSTIEVSNPTDRRNFRIRVPPAPETFYDIEWHNEEWVLPPKDFFIKMHAVIDRWRNEEISQREMDLLHCKIIVEELARKRKSQTDLVGELQENLEILIVWTAQDLIIRLETHP